MLASIPGRARRGLWFVFLSAPALRWGESDRFGARLAPQLRHHVRRDVDAGDVLAMTQVDLDDSWDAPKLYSELSRKGADLVRRTLPDYLAGKVKLTPQDVSQVTLAPKIKKEQGLIDWTLRANQICARLRAFSPWPGVWTTRSGKTLKILRAKAIEFKGSSPPGYLVSQDKFGFAVQCGGATALLISVVQPESRSRQPASEYLRGYPFVKGEYLGA